MDRHEAHRLICSAQSGNSAARDTLIEYYCSTLVPALAHRWGRLAFDDACAIGNLATVEAVNAALASYDPGQQSGIAAYVRRAIVRALSHADYQALTVHGPTKPNGHETPRASLSLDVLPETADDTANPEAHVINAETRQRLSALFGELFSARDAGILRMLYFEDMTAWAVAQRLNVSEALIDYVRTAALKTLRGNPETAAILCPRTPTRSIGSA